MNRNDYTIEESSRDIAKLKKGENFKICVYGENCKVEKSNIKISHAHSIQNNRFLKQFAEKGDVLVIDSNTTDFSTLQKKGRKKATTFLGFCNHHDTNLFKPIELGDYEGNEQQNFLFAYRGFAKEYFAKKKVVNEFEAKLKIWNKVSNPDDFIAECKKTSNTLIYAYQLILSKMEPLRIEMNEGLDKQIYDGLVTEIIKFPEEYKFAISSFFYIATDVKGNVVNDFSKQPLVIRPFFLNVFPQNGETFVLMSYFKRHSKVFEFVKDDIVDNDVEIQKKIISNMIAIYVDNIAMSPKSWRNIPEESQRGFHEAFNSSIGVISDSLLQYDINIFH